MRRVQMRAVAAIATLSALSATAGSIAGVEAALPDLRPAPVESISAATAAATGVEVLTRSGRWVAGIDATPTQAGELLIAESVEAAVPRRRLSIDEVAALVRTAPTERMVRSDLARIALHDGQRWLGTLRFPNSGDSGDAGDSGEPVWLGRLGRGGGEPIDLDLVRWVEIVPGAMTPQRIAESEAAAADRVELANGDLAEGLLRALGRVCELEPLAGGAAISIPIERIRSISLLPRTVRPGAVRIWNAGEEVLDGDAVWRPAGAHLEIDRGAAGRLQHPASEIVAIAWRPESIRPLAQVPARTLAGEAAALRGWLPPPRVVEGFAPLDASPIEISGPVRVRWSLEPGSIVVADAVLPAEARRFGDFELIARDGGRELFRVPFDRTTPRRPLRIEVASGELEFEMTLGRHGPIGDLLRLERALVLRPR
jgi:hypothetical protein